MADTVWESLGPNQEVGWRMIETIRLKFRRGGGWRTIEGVWLMRPHSTDSIPRCIYIYHGDGQTDPTHEYVGPLELVGSLEPEPEPLRIKGCEIPEITEDSIGKGWRCLSRPTLPEMARKEWEAQPILEVFGRTRRAAIEAYNAAARAMGAT